MSTLPIREKPKRINENREKVFPISFPSNSLERKPPPTRKILHLKTLNLRGQA